MKLKPADEQLVLSTLKKHKQFEQLSKEALSALMDVVVIQKIKKNGHIWKYGDPGEFCAMIIDGLFCIIRPSGAENFNCMGVFGNGDMIGLSALQKKIPFPGTAKLISSAGTVIKFYFRPLLQDKNAKYHQEIAYLLREMTLLHEQILLEKIDITGAGGAEQRLIELLLHFTRRFGIFKSNTHVVIPIEIKKTDAANLMDIRPETAIRLINRWVKEKHISWDKDQIVIHNLQHVQRRNIL